MLLNNLASFATQIASFATYAKGVTFDDNMLSSMVQETSDFTSYIFSNGSYQDWFTSDISFARTPGLMSVYNQTVAAPASVNAANAVHFAANTRVGLLTRAAMLVSVGGDQNPV